MPHSAIFKSSDPYEHQSSIRAGEVELLVTAPGRFQAELTRVDLHKLWMQRGRELLPRIAHVATDKSRTAIFFLADANQASMYHRGMELSPGCIAFYSSGSEHHQRTSTALNWAGMSLSPDDLAAAGQAIAGCDLVAPAVTQLIRPTPPLMSRLLQLHDAAGHLAATAPDILAHPEVAKAMEQKLVRVMVGCLTDGIIVENTNIGHQRVTVMRRFERFINSNPGNPVYIAEVCAAIGVAGRTLRLHCLNQLGMSPHRYLWLRRMTLAQRALIRAHPTSKTVTDIATDLGFWELGRFAVAYRRLFGEVPSATLRHEADHAPSVDRASELPVLP
jgi:AraC-like DNA-binding protein